jgi:hypothetical protein
VKSINKEGKELKKRILALLMASVIVLIFPVTVAAESDTSTLTGTVGATMTISSPETITLPSLIPGTTVASTSQSLTISTNTNGWSLIVTENSGSNDGKMEKSGGVTMTYPVYVKGGELSIYNSMAAPVTLKNATGVPCANQAIEGIFFQQQVAANEAPGIYSMTVLFTANPGGY